MNKWMVIASAALVWGAGVVATGALVVWVRPPSPPVPAKTPESVADKKVAAPPPVAAAIVAPESRIQTLRSYDIVGSAPPSAPTPKTKPQPKPKAEPEHSAAETHCSAFRPLEQGSSSVQICD